MKVSVIVLSYNSAATIGRALDSIISQKRDFDMEIFVGAGASAAGTRAVVEDYA
ncbi:MAG: glycosyltransferase, partial [Muribaculaceae bacterium]|nr:glycosyltransferase [Muribaculaceae bacterium]